MRCRMVAATAVRRLALRIPRTAQSVFDEIMLISAITKICVESAKQSSVLNMNHFFYSIW